jgi:hypothetical protein
MMEKLEIRVPRDIEVYSDYKDCQVLQDLLVIKDQQETMA